MRVVVYLLTPTSNHNYLFLCSWCRLLYIFWLLHQTTTLGNAKRIRVRCISFDSYIKPQHFYRVANWENVVYLLTPTSNHNCCESHLSGLQLYIFWLLHQTTTVSGRSGILIRCISFDSYIKPQPKPSFSLALLVVYLLTPTSNHNLTICLLADEGLYIFWLLHQTTTRSWCWL